MAADPHRSVRRMLDANLNRLSEALRVVEDVCRFHWNQPGFGGALKEMRHRVFACLEAAGLTRREVLRERDIEGDVGRDVASPGAPVLGPEQLAFRNLQRAKEALRVVEECSKTCVPGAADSLEKIRYQLYAEEKGLGHLAAGPAACAKRLEEARLYLLVVPELCSAPVDVAVSAAIEGGVDVVQLRSKALADREALRLARRVRELTARSGTLFIVNDRPELARLSHADGVHLGQDDLPVPEARTIVGDEVLIGLSTHSRAQARAAGRQAVDYIGVGPVFPTRTKRNHEAVLGPEEVAGILELAPVPAFAIGGITAGNLPDLVSAGCDRIAVASAILGAAEPGEAARRLRALLDAVPRLGRVDTPSADSPRH